MRRRIVLALAAFLMALPAWGLTVLQLNLEQLAALSEKVFVGRCLSVGAARDRSGRQVQTVTFQIEEMLKGEPAEKVTFRQLAASPDGIFPELPQYEVGEEAVVFLSEAGGLGLTAPVGLGQGRFRIETTENGRGVINGTGNRALFRGWKKSPRYKSIGLTSSEKKLIRSSSGPLPYEDFLSVVRKLSAP